MIEVEGVSKRFGEIQALKNITFSVEKGEIVGFLGANGAGKTTTMDIICGCLGADEGTVKISGYDITSDPLEAKRRLGYLPDVPPLYQEMRVIEAIEYAARLNKVAGPMVKTRADKVLEQLSLGSVQKRLIGNLSKGFRQRVAFAQALVHDPEVLVLDEPTEGLDPNQIVHMRELIRAIRGDHTIILSSHILSEVQSTCDKIVIIHQGQIAQQGTYAELVKILETGSLYRLRVGKNSRELVGALSRVNGVSGPRLIADDNETIEFAVANIEGATALDDVARTVVDGGYGLRELTVKTKSLEEVFFKITN
jgi:ABC-2 type transport system ATP-binding protein